MKFYFAGSIRGGRQRAELYAKMIACMKEYGTVLTEHVGYVAAASEGTDREIWARDMAWLEEADAVIGECTAPSLGVGYELAMAKMLGKKTVLFYCGGDGRLSAMLAGDPYYEIHICPDEASLMAELAAVLKHWAAPAGI